MSEKEINIMVVDDDLSNVESLKMILKIKDYNVDGFTNAIEAIKFFEKGKCDICFLNLNLHEQEQPYGGMRGGLEVLKKLKEIDPDTEIIMATGYAGIANERLNAITLGAMEFIDKPYMMEDIYSLIDRALRKRREKGTKK